MLQKIEYQNNPISFDFTNQSEMINATEMAKIFGKKTLEFLEKQETKNFIESLQKKLNSDFQGGNSHLELSEMIVKVTHGGRNNGTWMHRLLALKFAAWLNADFELWVYETIEKLLFGKSNAIVESQKARFKYLQDLKFSECIIEREKANIKQLNKKLEELDKVVFEQLELKFDDFQIDYEDLQKLEQ